MSLGYIQDEYWAIRNIQTLYYQNNFKNLLVHCSKLFVSTPYEFKVKTTINEKFSYVVNQIK